MLRVFLLQSCFLLVVIASAQSQHSLGVRLNGGFSRINIEESSTWESQSDEWDPAFAGGVFYTFKPMDYLRLSAGVGAHLISGTRVNTGIIDYNGVDTVASDLNLERRITFANFFIAAGFEHGPLAVDIGLQFGSNIQAKENREQELTFISLDSTSTLSVSGRDLDLEQMDFGPMITIIYDINELFSIEGSYYQGLRDINPATNRGDIIWNTQRVGIGLRYHFWRKEAEPTL